MGTQLVFGNPTCGRYLRSRWTLISEAGIFIFGQDFFSHQIAPSNERLVGRFHRALDGFAVATGPGSRFGATLVSYARRVYSTQGDFEIAALFIGFAMVLDTVDGKTYQGWKYYNLNCARCHGEDALGTTIAPHLILSLKPDGTIPNQAMFVATVCGGRPQKGMPAWCTIGLTPAQIDGIVLFTVEENPEIEVARNLGIKALIITSLVRSTKVSASPMPIPFAMFVVTACARQYASSVGCAIQRFHSGTSPQPSCCGRSLNGRWVSAVPMTCMRRLPRKAS